VPPPVRLFARQYVEMALAMLLGMAILYPQWLLLTSGIAHRGWVMRPEVDSLAMATAMSVPMVGWMVHRGHSTRLTAEMCLSAYAGFVVLFPLYWSGALDDMGLMMAGHVLMPFFVLAAVMLLRRREYAAFG
jgi:hypothetical protein